MTLRSADFESAAYAVPPRWHVFCGLCSGSLVLYVAVTLQSAYHFYLELRHKPHSAPWEARTPDQLVKSQLLYLLS